MKSSASEPGLTVFFFGTHLRFSTGHQTMLFTHSSLCAVLKNDDTTTADLTVCCCESDST